ncbi:hypothetical protein TNCV_1288031 [Trichonephila clavipes]|nr:hypothetical protein TNCV_1288031 [Trichonephila clavipes]
MTFEVVFHALASNTRAPGDGPYNFGTWSSDKGRGRNLSKELPLQTSTPGGWLLQGNDNQWGPAGPLEGLWKFQEESIIFLKSFRI